MWRVGTIQTYDLTIVGVSRCVVKFSPPFLDVTLRACSYHVRVSLQGEGGSATSEQMHYIYATKNIQGVVYLQTITEMLVEQH